MVEVGQYGGVMKMLPLTAITILTLTPHGDQWRLYE